MQGLVEALLAFWLFKTSGRTWDESLVYFNKRKKKMLFCQYESWECSFFIAAGTKYMISYLELNPIFLQPCANIHVWANQKTWVCKCSLFLWGTFHSATFKVPEALKHVYFLTWKKMVMQNENNGPMSMALK